MRTLAVLGVFCLVLVGCTRVFFQPMPQLVRNPSDIGLKYEDVWLRSEDALWLHAWFLPSVGTATGSVLFLHGNAENISTHLGAVAWLPQKNFNVFLLDYGGYGRSQGTPSIAGALDDIDAAMAHLVARTDIDNHRIAIFGQSLGGALAILYVARSRYRTNIRGLITDSAFSSFRGIAKEKLRASWPLRVLATPLSWTISNSFRPTDAIASVAPIPVLIFHGEADSIVPVSHAQRLFEAAREPKEIWRFPNAPHIASLTQESARQRFVQSLEAQMR